MKHLAPHIEGGVAVAKVAFNYDTESWESRRFELPYFGGEYVILTPRESSQG